MILAVQEPPVKPSHPTIASKASASIGAGMRNPVNVYLIAQSCYRCHTVPDEQLVNDGGHVAGSMDFEFVAWSQGTLRHNFVRTNGQTNDASSRQRLRQMFMAGMIADLEFSLRATASAHSESRVCGQRCQTRCPSRQAFGGCSVKLNQPLLEDILTVFQSVELKINNRQQLTAAADRINFLGIRFAATVDGEALEPMDEFIPVESNWK